MITKKEATAYFFLCAAPGMHRAFLGKRGWWWHSALLVTALTSLLKGFDAGFYVGIGSFSVLVMFDAVLIHKWVEKDGK